MSVRSTRCAGARRRAGRRALAARAAVADERASDEFLTGGLKEVRDCEVPLPASGGGGGSARLTARALLAWAAAHVVRERPELFLAPRHGTHWCEATPDAFGVYDTARERVAGEGPMPNFPSTAVDRFVADDGELTVAFEDLEVVPLDDR